ncbi:MAG: NB-ARC domain-containing protein, partial [Verrucomicrobiia bacterium]
MTAKDIAAGRDVNINKSSTNIGQLVLFSQNYVRGPLHQLPSLTEHFTGRGAELKTLCEGIRQRAKEGKPNAIVSAIEGLPGVGKTELAVAVAYELASDFPEAQIILRLAAHSTSPATPAQVRDDLLHMIHADAKLPEDDGALWKLYQNIFRNDDSGQRRRMLLILDDVSGDDQVRALLPPPGCAVLITSRRALASGESLRLTTFLPAEAIALLQLFRADLTEADAGAVAELCGFLAIALQAAGGFLKCHVAKPAAEYIDELRGDRLKRLHHEDAQFDVNGVFERSLRDMTEPQRAAFHRLSVMAYGFDREAALAVAGSNGNDLDELVSLNLLEFHPPTQRFDWHDLLRAFAAKGLTEDEIAARMNHARHFTAVAKRARELCMMHGKTLDGLALFDRERRNIEAAFEFLHSICSGGLRPPSENSAVRPAVRDRRYSKEVVVVACRQLLALVDAVVYTSDLRFHPRHQRIPWLEAQLAAAREIGDRASGGSTLGNLGLAYAALGDARKAIEYYDQA